MQVSPDRSNRMALGHQCGPAASQPHVDGAAPPSAFGDSFTVLHNLHRIPISHERLGEADHFRAGS